ncbi:MAG TPA: hypothetical protein VJV23_16140 [Candidatus Polarisedimenticolia bacterium]|nr:hypothetical protein [Candidatus Polarisedimenticolia bacterium]
MAGKKASVWLWGCGAGCGLLVLLLVVMGAAAGFYFKRLTSGFDQAVKDASSLEQRHGAPETFTPSADGSIPAERMEAFLSVREAMGPVRVTLAEAFRKLPSTPAQIQDLEKKSGLDKFWTILSVGRVAVDFGSGMGEFFRARSQALLDAEMGMGEYGYIYAMAYWSWLGRSSSGGPGPSPATVPSFGEGGAEGGAEFHLLGAGVQARLRGQLLQMLRNQLAALPDGADPEWRDSLAAEVAALEEDPSRIPWSGAIPGPLAASLEPYRERLLRTYDPRLDPFELASPRQRHAGGYSAE